MTRELTPLFAAGLSFFTKQPRAQLAARFDGGAGLPRLRLDRSGVALLSLPTVCSP
jgi:hypothetical protein